MTELRADALVVRGGVNHSLSYVRGAGVLLDDRGMLQNVSVNSANEVSLQELTAANRATGYRGIPHAQVGVCTVGAVRAVGGAIESTPTRVNRYHATLSGITPEMASVLFRPTIPNPNRNG